MMMYEQIIIAIDSNLIASPAQRPEDGCQDQHLRTSGAAAGSHYCPSHSSHTSPFPCLAAGCLVLLLLLSCGTPGASADELDFRLIIPKDPTYTKGSPAGFYCQISGGIAKKARKALAAIMGYESCGFSRCPVPLVRTDCKWRTALRNSNNPNHTGAFVLR